MAAVDPDSARHRRSTAGAGWGRELDRARRWTAGPRRRRRARPRRWTANARRRDELARANDVARWHGRRLQTACDRETVRRHRPQPRPGTNDAGGQPRCDRQHALAPCAAARRRLRRRPAATSRAKRRATRSRPAAGRSARTRPRPSRRPRPAAPAGRRGRARPGRARRPPRRSTARRAGRSAAANRAPHARGRRRDRRATGRWRRRPRRPPRGPRRSTARRPRSRPPGRCVRIRAPASRAASANARVASSASTVQTPSSTTPPSTDGPNAGNAARSASPSSSEVRTPCAAIAAPFERASASCDGVRASRSSSRGVQRKSASSVPYDATEARSIAATAGSVWCSRVPVLRPDAPAASVPCSKSVTRTAATGELVRDRRARDAAAHDRDFGSAHIASVPYMDRVIQSGGEQRARAANRAWAVAERARGGERDGQGDAVADRVRPGQPDRRDALCARRRARRAVRLTDPGDDADRARAGQGSPACARRGRGQAAHAGGQRLAGGGARDRLPTRTDAALEPPPARGDRARAADRGPAARRAGGRDGRARRRGRAALSRRRPAQLRGTRGGPRGRSC